MSALIEPEALEAARRSDPREVAGTFLADDVSGSLIMTAVDAAAPLVKGDRRTAAQRRLDAFTDICRRYLGSPDAPMVGGGHAHVIVTVDAAALTAGGGWSLQRTSDGAYLLGHRDGRTIGPEPHSGGHSRPPPAFPP